MGGSKAGLLGGVDLGGTNIHALVTGVRGGVRGEARRASPHTGGPRDVAKAIAAAVGEACDAAGLEPGELKGLGVGTPGDVDGRTGRVSNLVNFPGWEGSFELGRWLRRRLGTPVSVGNDVTVATLGEARLGAGRGYASVLGVFWGTGVGAGIVLDGQPWVGRGAAGEIGHVVVRRNGARCPCGRRGCMEAYAGRAAMEAKARRDYEAGEKTRLFKIMRKRKRERLTSAVWVQALEEDDPLASRLMDRAVGALAAGIGSAVNLLDPEVVVIGGGLGVRLGQPFLDRLDAAMQEHVFAVDRPPKLELAALGDRAGALGAALLAG